MKVRKAVVTAAGWGTRFLPATKSLPKEMLPLVDKPLIQYIVEEAVDSGIEHIIIVTASGKRAIADHFDRCFELEEVIRKKGDKKLLDELLRITNLADICYVRQKEQLGLGHAVSVARRAVGDEPFALFLPDDIIVSEVPAMKQMLRVFDRYNSSIIAVESVSPQNTLAYGIVEPEKAEERVYQALRVVEKPKPEEAPSNLGIVGRYILVPDIFKMLEKTKPGKGGEIQLTDAIQLLIRQQKVYAYEFEGKRYDTGNPLGFLQASVELASQHPQIGSDFRKFLKSIMI